MERKLEKESQGKRTNQAPAAQSPPYSPLRCPHLPPVITLMTTTNPHTLIPTLIRLPLLTSFLERSRILTVGTVCTMSDRPSTRYSQLPLRFKDNSFGRRVRVKVTLQELGD